MTARTTSYACGSTCFSTSCSDPTDELLTVTGLFTHFFGLDTTMTERKFFRQLAQLIGTRAARLSACGIAAIVKKMGYLEEGCGVGADGSLYSKYPKFPERLHQGLEDIFGEKGKKVVTHQAEDGSGVGSAIIAGAFDFLSDIFCVYFAFVSLMLFLLLLRSANSHDQGAQGRRHPQPRLIGVSRSVVHRGRQTRKSTPALFFSPSSSCCKCIA